MRMRKKKHGAERIAACSALLIPSTEALADGFDAFFPEKKPIYLEIGCGKGNFACGMAKKYPDGNFVAMERVADVCCIALEKAMAASDERACDNLRFLIGNANLLAEGVPPHSVNEFVDRDYSALALCQIQRFYFEFFEYIKDMEFDTLCDRLAECISSNGLNEDAFARSVCEQFGIDENTDFGYVYSAEVLS